MNVTLCGQLARDYCCSQEDVLDNKNHFTEYSRIDGRRRYQEKEECFLKLVAGFVPAWAELVTDKIG